MYGEMVLDSFNLNRPGMIIFRPIMIISGPLVEPLKPLETFKLVAIL